MRVWKDRTQTVQSKDPMKITYRTRRLGVCGAMFLCALLLVALFLFSGCEIDERGQVTVPVMLTDTDGIRVLSDNPVSVPLGGSAVFEVEVEESIAFDMIPEGVTVADGKITVPSVWFPKTVNLSTHRRTQCDLYTDVAIYGTGELTSNVGNGTFWSETEVVLTATPTEGFLFTGFSIGATAENGGEIVAIEPTYAFTLSENVKIYANFAMEWVDPATTVKVPEDKWVLIYHANGGYLTDTGRDGTKTVEFSNTYYHCPNTLADRDYFDRDGYVLYGYNTEADGSGTYYAPGWNVVMPERGAISLFCMWAKVSDEKDFEYRMQDGLLYLTKYQGNDEFVVVPEKINGTPVYGIMSRTFDECQMMKSLMITKNIRKIFDKAVYMCYDLETLYFSDSVREITDAAFQECDNLKTLCLLAVVQPRYLSSRNGTYAIKYERLITAEGPKLVIASGSNSAYGINSPHLEELLKKGGHPYSVVNYGQNAGTALTFYVEVIASHMNEGDVLVLAPEINKFQFGYSEINTTLWQIFEGAYDAFSRVDIRHYSQVFNSFVAFNNARNHTAYNEKSYEVFTTDTVNSYGDYSKNKVGYEKSYAKTVQALLDKGGVGSWNYNSNVNSINTYGDQLNRTLDLAIDAGGTVLISFAASNIINFKADSQVAGGEPQRNFEKAVDEKLHGTRISEVATYTMPTELFYNSHNHPTSAGAIERTGWLAEDLLAYFDSAEKD